MKCLGVKLPGTTPKGSLRRTTTLPKMLSREYGPRLAIHNS